MQDIAAAPGWKLCSCCYKNVQGLNEEESTSQDESDSLIEFKQQSQQQQCASFNESFKPLDASPVKLKSVPKHQQSPRENSTRLL